MARPVGRPRLPYDTRQVMLNIRTEYHVKMKGDGINMSKLVNDFLHDRFSYSICPTCYQEDFDVEHCKKCNGRALFCRAMGCKSHQSPQMWECRKQPEPCSADEFRMGER